MSEYKYSIEANNVNKSFKKNGVEVNALNDFSIKIKSGSIYGLLGPNGAGKSTFINILGGLVKKNDGNIKICGIDLDLNAKVCRRKIGIVPQELNIDPFFSPIELLELQAGLYGVKKKDRRSDEILSNVGLLEQRNAYARTLSGGMRRRLLVAKALVHNPEIIILDEPTSSLDAITEENIIKEILSIDELTVILISHNPKIIEKCDNILNLKDQTVISN